MTPDTMENPRADGAFGERGLVGDVMENWTGVDQSPGAFSLYCRTRNFTNVTGVLSFIDASVSPAAIGGSRIHA